MARVLLLGFVLTAACGYKPLERLSLCAGAAPPPGCSASCAAGAPCPAGYHCAADDTCDAQCTQTGSECADGDVCSPDGFCTDGGDPPDDGSCAPVRLMATSTTPTVQLLIDQSASMIAAYGNISRWDAMRNALIDPTTGVVANLSRRVAFGATLFSAQMASPPCPRLTSEPRMLDNFTAIRQLLVTAAPLESTPTPAAINAVIDDFIAHPAAPGSPPLIVLATDGLPNSCAIQNPTPADQQAALNDSVAAAQRAYITGIRLYFLFVGDSIEAGDHPQRMANAGAGLDPATGTAPFFAASNPAALTAEFRNIIAGAISCDVKLARRVNPSAGPSGSILFNTTSLTYGAEWALDPDGTTVHLFGNGCAMLKTAATVTIEATFPCGS